MAWLQQRHGNKLQKSHPSPTRITRIFTGQVRSCVLRTCSFDSKIKTASEQQGIIFLHWLLHFPSTFCKNLPLLGTYILHTAPFLATFEKNGSHAFPICWEKSQLLWQDPHFYPSIPLRRWSGGSFQWGGSWEGAKQKSVRRVAHQETNSPQKKNNTDTAGVFVLRVVFCVLFLEKEINTNFKEDSKTFGWIYSCFCFNQMMFTFSLAQAN